MGYWFFANAPTIFARSGRLCQRSCATAARVDSLSMSTKPSCGNRKLQEFILAPIARGNEAVDSALQFIANATTVKPSRQAQAVVRPLCCATSLAQTAQVADPSVRWISKLRLTFPPGSSHGRQHFTFELEHCSKSASLLQGGLQVTDLASAAYWHFG